MHIQAIDRNDARYDGVYIQTAFGNSLNYSSGTRTYTFDTDQMLNFIPGKFNEFQFKITMTNPQYLNPSSVKRVKWMISDIKTSVPEGYSFELKLQKNWESYFNIKVVKDTDRNSKGTSTGLTTVSVTPPSIGNGWTLTSDWQWNEYNTSAGYKHWEIPATTFTVNKNFDLTPIFFPENDDYCSMEPTFKTPGPKAPWNLLSRHETFWYAPTWMRISDYAQNISANPIWYCPRNFRAVVWLKQGTATDDVI